MLNEKNMRSFTDVCNGEFGRKVIYSSAKEINSENVVSELSKALSVHRNNREEIEYLDRYYRGNQPILFRVKNVRPEINNKIVENHAFEIVEHKVSEMFGEPVQLVLSGTEESKSRDVDDLNRFMKKRNKSDCDNELGRWRSICGTGYRFVWVEPDDKVPFDIETLDPRNAFVVYSTGNGHKPLYSVQITQNIDGENEYFIYTKNETFNVSKNKIVGKGTNGMFKIPVVEYPNNSRRLSDIEIVITITDALNKMQSDRMNGIEQFVQSFIKFVNCEIDEKTFVGMCSLGAITAKTVNPATPAQIDSITTELNQQHTQIAKDDLYDNMLIIEGMPDRQENSGGDTGQAVVLRNGFYFSEKRAELNESIFKKSENQFLDIVFGICETKRLLSLDTSDIDIKVTRSKMDNMQIKAQVLQMLLSCGVNQDIAIKTVSLWSDPEKVCNESRETIKMKFEAGLSSKNGGGLVD